MGVLAARVDAIVGDAGCVAIVRAFGAATLRTAAWRSVDDRWGNFAASDLRLALGLGALDWAGFGGWFLDHGKVLHGKGGDDQLTSERFFDLKRFDLAFDGQVNFGF